jgi:hypothetical protein
MDAMTLLRAVAETYTNLKSLAVELQITNQSEDDGVLNRREWPARAFFVAPDNLRIELGGKRGSVTVTNGIDLHQYFAGPKHYSKNTVQWREGLPGWFKPDFPISGRVTFLFGRIAERVAAAEILREELVAVEGSEAQCQVISVTYKPPPYPHLIESSSPVVFWVNSGTHLISRVEGETIHRRPAHDETYTDRTISVFTRAIKNEPIPPETFEFTPPADALDASDPSHRSTCLSGGTGGGGAEFDPDKGGRFESWNSHDWAGGTLIEQSKLKFYGLDLAFERRLTLSDDRRELRVVERIFGPKGQTERELSIPVA